MTDESEESRRHELEELRELWDRESPLDALEAFVPQSAAPDPVLEELISRTGFSRWKPVEGGHQVLILYHGGDYDSARFTLRKGGWGEPKP